MRKISRVSLVFFVSSGFLFLFLALKWPISFSEVEIAHSAYPPPSMPSGFGAYPPPGEWVTPVIPASVSTTETKNEAPADGMVSEVDQPLLMDARMYASMNNVSVEEAMRRLKLQSVIGDLNGELSRNEKDTFSGMWIQHQPDFRVIVQFTRYAAATIQEYIRSLSLENIVALTLAERSLEELEKTQSQVAQICTQLGIAYNTSINVKANYVELYVASPSDLEASLRAANLHLPAKVEVIRAGGLPIRVFP